MSMFYAGIDWADDHHDIVVIDEADTRKGSLSTATRKTGTEIVAKRDKIW